MLVTIDDVPKNGREKTQRGKIKVKQKSGA
jgi:hypothetical protein